MHNPILEELAAAYRTLHFDTTHTNRDELAKAHILNAERMIADLAIQEKDRRTWPREDAA